MPATEVKKLQDTLKASPAARASFVNGIIKTLADQGVNVHNSDVLRQFGLDFDLHSGKKIGGSVASSAVVTIIY